MAPYSTNADLANACGGDVRFLQLSDLNGDRAVDQTVIDAAILSADRLIDSYINKQVLVPLVAPIPQTIIDMSAQLAVYKIRRNKGLLDQGSIDAHVLDLKWLEDVRDGKITLGVDPSPTKASARIDGTSTRPTSKDISRAKMRGFS